MEILSKKIKFFVVLFIAMIFLLLIYDRIGYNSHHLMAITVHNSPIVVNANQFGQSLQKEQQISNFDAIKGLSSEENLLNRRTANRSPNREEYNLESERKLTLNKVLQFESKYLVSTKKWSKDSKLLYQNQIKSITVMQFGDKGCDNSYGSALKVVIVVISRVNGFERRRLIRETWAQRMPESKDVRLYFAIGLSEDSKVEKQIVVENNEFNDLLQWNFVDNYYNLTIKSLAILRWFSLNCFRTKFLYKVDDDCIVNHHNLVKFSENASQNTIYGHLWRKAFVDRNKRSKFYLSKSDYKSNFYPDYTGGPWLMSGAVVPLLYQTAITKSLPALPYEDVYITGVVAERAHIKRKQLTGLIYFSKSMFNKLNNCWFEENIIFWQNLDDLMIRNIWKNIENSRNLICIKSNGTTVYPKVL